MSLVQGWRVRDGRLCAVAPSAGPWRLVGGCVYVVFLWVGFVYVGGVGGVCCDAFRACYCGCGCVGLIWPEFVRLVVFDWGVSSALGAGVGVSCSSGWSGVPVDLREHVIEVARQTCCEG